MPTLQFEPTVIAGQPIGWTCSSGRVAGLNKYSKTFVSGGGSTYQGSGSTTIHSSVAVRTEYHLVHVDGSESPHFFNKESVMLRDGQRVSLLCGETTGKMILTLINHDQREFYWVSDMLSFLTGLKVFWDPGGCLSLLSVGILPVIQSIRYSGMSKVVTSDATAHSNRILASTDLIEWPQVMDH
jgi:hypothetical protein